MNGISWRTLLYVAVGGIAGALARYAVVSLTSGLSGNDELGTLIANISGAFLLGVFAVWSSDRASIGPDVRRGVMVGLFGSYTTLSALSYQTVVLLEDGKILLAILYSAVSFVLGILAVAGGIRLAKR